MVYEFCDDYILPHGIDTLYLTPITPAFPTPSFATRLKFYNLMRVNQQLRTEFRPIYMRKTPIWISYYHVFQYLADFYGINTIIRDNITIDLFDLCLKTASKEEDILPLLRQLSKYRGLQVRFRTLSTPTAGASLFGLSPLLNQCLAKMHTREWKDLMSEDPRRIMRIVPRKSTKKLVLYLAEVEKRHVGRRKRRFERHVLQNLGLDGGVSWNAIVKYEITGIGWFWS
jgi:hypothetical protein